jgi:uncharacterized repeat protein (TIGR02543 family)
MEGLSMKRGFFAILAVLMVFAMVFISCGDGSDSGKDNIPKDKWRVTFKYDGGKPTSPAYKDVIKDDVVGELPTPTKDGFNLEGWFDADGTQWDANTRVTKNVTLTAKWVDGTTPIVYTVTFNKNNEDPDATEPNPTTRTVRPPVEKISALPAEPTRPGYIFDGWNRDPDGLGTVFTRDTVVTSSFIVYAQWKQGFQITFNSNGGGTVTPATKQVIPPDTHIDALPTPPTRAGYTFVKWNKDQNGTGDDFDATTTVTASFTVYAQWLFSWGTPEVVGQTLVHNNPLFEKTGESGAGINNNTGTYKLTSPEDWLDYRFPSGVNKNTYDYFIIAFELNGTGEGASVVLFNQYGTETRLLTGNGNEPAGWMANRPNSRAVFEVQGAEDTGGFRMQGESGTTNLPSLGITSITFYKAPRYKVSFTGGGAISDVTNIWGGDDNHPGYAVGADKWPADPTDPVKFFVNWTDADGNIVTANTKITKNLVLEAQWADEPLDPRYIEKITNSNVAAGGPMFAFELSGATLADYKTGSITFKLKADAAAISGRLRAGGPMNTTEQTTPEALSEVEFTTTNDEWPTAYINATGSQSDRQGHNVTNTANISQAADAGWTPYTLNFLSSEPSITWKDDTTGIVLFALGVIGNPGGVNNQSYYIKDVTLTKAGGADPLPAMDPKDDKLWGGAKPNLFARNGDNAAMTVIREKLPYQED